MDANTPLTADQQAAHDFLTELRTRITTQGLPYQYGTDARAMESLWELFAQGRAAIKKYPGCEVFAHIVTELLNVHLRPVTSKWHRPFVEGQLDARDGADEFRGDLLELQETLRDYANRFHEMAYDSKDTDEQTREAISRDAIEAEFESVKFGIPLDSKNTDDQPFAQINATEADEIKARRGKYNITTVEGCDAVGLALSGGGIRSATFSLGVVQVLADRKLLNHVDYLSTVSGGGYTGCFLTRCLGDGLSQEDMASPHGPDPEPIRYLRQHAKFLAARNLKESWAMVTATLGGMLLNWTAPLFAITAVAIATVLCQYYFDAGKILRTVLMISGILSGGALVAWGISMRKEQQNTRTAGAVLAGLTALTAWVAVILALSKGYAVTGDAYTWLKAHWTLSAAIGGLITAAPAIIRFLPVLKDPKIRQLVLQALLWTAGLLVPVLGVILFYALWHVKDIPFENFPITGISNELIGVCLLSAIAALSGFIAFKVLNINLTGPHRFYRDGLAKTFVRIPNSPTSIAALTDINNRQSAPYHLINATLNVPSNQKAALQDRRCDFFLFSKHWMGSPSIGYFNTNTWRTNGNPVDLATAMATSGAALSAHMGLGAMPTLTALLAFLNLRLGFWIKNPNIKSHFSQPGFWCLIREMLGIGMSEDKPWLNLSDGGHIENMAVYELLRRRCKFIICVDGEADPDFTFGGLMTLVRHAQIDFGVRIEPMLNDIRPNPQTGLSKSHAHFCRIHYPKVDGAEAATGFLLYVKLSVTGNESELIKRYRITHPDFPHQTTLDQFFDEEQFEAYRQLGVHVAEGLFSRVLMGAGTEPNSVDDWFRRLAANLLLPERIHFSEK